MSPVRILILSAAFLASSAVSGPVSAGVPTRLVRNGKSTYKIVIPDHATPVEEHAASELQNYLEQMSGARLPIVSDTLGAAHHLILIGRTKLTPGFLSGGTLDTLEPDGYAISSGGEKLVICGGTGKGTLYGVYSLLEDNLGCRKYSAKITVVPKSKNVTILPTRLCRNPYFRHREIYYLEAYDRGYSDWHKLLSMADQQEQWGMWVHTFDRLVPSSEYFATHPEYFSFFGGRRIPNGQLCLSNPDVFSLLTKHLREMIAKQPSAHTWSVSQNDNANECQCTQCRALDERFGGSSGAVLDFVNRVAAEFPDKTISTLAYWYTRGAPAHVRPAANVNIMFCSIECNRSQPIATDSTSASFRRDLENWGALTDNILVWDYVVQFRNLVSPFPNLRVLKPNIQYFAAHNVRKMFQQGCGANVGEFGELRTYMIAKLLWNPSIDIDRVMDDFLDGYYGRAGKFIKSYITLMHDALAHSGKQLSIYGYPFDAIDGYLSPQLIKTYSRLFDEAEKAVRGKPEILERVKNARLPLEFAILDISLHSPTPELSYFDRKSARWSVRASMRTRLNEFVRQAKSAGVERLEEGGTSPDEYQRSIEQMLQIPDSGDLAFRKPVKLLTAYSEKYPAGGGSALTDGLRGPNDYHCNWLGFEGENLDAIIDLEAAKTVQSVNSRFLQSIEGWIWLPLNVEYSTSLDGTAFTPVATLQDTVPDTAPGSFARDFVARFQPVQARYIRVSAHSRLNCPDWHFGAGQKSWIFVDEVVVE